MDRTKKRERVRLKMTFLGTGTSTGTPQLGCQCAVCSSSDPRDMRLRSSALLEWEGGTTILVDCGPDFRQQALRHPFARLDGVLITHEHYDHVGGLDDLRPYCYPDGLTLYAPSNTAAALRTRMPYAFAEHRYPGAPQLELVEVSKRETFRIATLEVQPVEVMHYKLPMLGYRIGTFAYVTDKLTISPEEEAKLQGLDLLVLNALRIKPHLSHQTLSDALSMVKRLQPKRCYLIHPSHDIGLHAKVSAMLPSNVFLAYDGLIVEEEITLPNG